MNKTLEYYDQNAKGFADSSVAVEFEHMQKRFASLIPEGGYILDFGCGSGRDTKAFLEMGYKVDAIDGSEKLCELASEFTGIPVKQMLFGELDECERYDGIWACSSILHLPKDELKSVFKRMIRAVKPEGFIYTSFKYGEFEGYRHERHFTDFTEESFKEFIADMTELKIHEEWVSSDVRPGRGEEKWLNLILKRSGTI